MPSIIPIRRLERRPRILRIHTPLLRTVLILILLPVRILVLLAAVLRWSVLRLHSVLLLRCVSSPPLLLRRIWPSGFAATRHPSGPVHGVEPPLPPATRRDAAEDHKEEEDEEDDGAGEDPAAPPVPGRLRVAFTVGVVVARRADGPIWNIVSVVEGQ